MKYQYAQLTDKGGRNENQDSSGYTQFENSTALFVIADGLGGHAGGLQASRLAIDSILNSAKTGFQFNQQGLKDLQIKAQKVVREQQQQDLSKHDMRTTLVILAIQQDKALWLHCGDSRLYLFREGQIIARTTDHTVAAVLHVTGDIEFEEIRHHADRNLLLRCVGAESADKHFSVAKNPISLQQHDRFLLCTDGFWELVDEQEMISLWQDNLTEWLESMRKLILKRGTDNYDNYTACAVHIE